MVLRNPIKGPRTKLRPSGCNSNSVTHVVIILPTSECNRPFANAPCGEKEFVLCDDPAKDAPMNSGPPGVPMRNTSETFWANVVHLITSLYNV